MKGITVVAENIDVMGSEPTVLLGCVPSAGGSHSNRTETILGNIVFEASEYVNEVTITCLGQGNAYSEDMRVTITRGQTSIPFCFTDVTPGTPNGYLIGLVQDFYSQDENPDMDQKSKVVKVAAFSLSEG